MIDYLEAQFKVMRSIAGLRAAFFPLRECLGRVLAADIRSPLALPVFSNSAVDGFAVASGSGLQWKVIGEIAAGSRAIIRTLRRGEAVRIFTGAPVPPNAFAVIMQEKVSLNGSSVTAVAMPKKNENIRFKGEDIQKGDILLKKGTVLYSQHLGLLAAAGLSRAPIFPPPSIAFFSTGSELVSPGRALGPGKIYDSNSVMLEALIRESGAVSYPLPPVIDRSSRWREAIRRGLEKDILIITGGVSVGKYDRVRGYLKKMGVRKIFWKVNIKPGKPVFFGKKGRHLVFGLPGNPAAVYITFMEFVLPAIQKWMAKERDIYPSLQVRMAHPVANGGRWNFLRMRCQRNGKGFEGIPLNGQGSHQVGELASAQGILRVAPNSRLPKGCPVPVRLIGGELP